MTTIKTRLGALIMTSVMASGAFAEPVDDTLILNGETEMVTRTAAPAHIADAMDEVMSGWLFREDETRAMQADDFDNPGMIFVEQARGRLEHGGWVRRQVLCRLSRRVGEHGWRASGLSEVERGGRRSAHVGDADQRLPHDRMGAEAWKYAGGDMVNMTALISSVSRGMPVNVAIDGPAQSTWEQGKEIYYTRYGQLELACSNCHEDNYGNMIRADHLSQGQINGFPVYRLKNTKLNSAHNRFKGCIRDTRAETFKEGSPEFIALELYVASRGNGLSVEGPSVRN